MGSADERLAGDRGADGVRGWGRGDAAVLSGESAFALKCAKLYFMGDWMIREDRKYSIHNAQYPVLVLRQKHLPANQGLVADSKAVWKSGVVDYERLMLS